MYKINRPLSVFLAVLMLLGVFTGCHKSDSPASPSAPAESAPAETTPTTPSVPAEDSLTVSDGSTAPQLPGTPDPPTEPAPGQPVFSNDPRQVSYWVTDGFREEIVWTSETGYDYRILVAVPEIRNIGEFVRSFNARMEQFAADTITELHKCAADKTDTHLMSIHYDAYLNGETLSILLTEETGVDLTYYQVWNFDVDDREEMTAAEMADEYLDLSYPQFLMLTNNVILSEFSNTYGSLQGSDGDFYHQILETIRRDTVAMYSRSLYLNENGRLMLCYDAPSMAGAMYYPTVTELSFAGQSVPSEREAYTWFFDLVAAVDGAYATGYGNLLKLAFEEDDDDFAEALARRTDTEIETIVYLLVGSYEDSQRLARLATDIDEHVIRNAILNALK